MGIRFPQILHSLRALVSSVTLWSRFNLAILFRSARLPFALADVAHRLRRHSVFAAEFPIREGSIA